MIAISVDGIQYWLDAPEPDGAHRTPEQRDGTWFVSVHAARQAGCRYTAYRRWDEAAQRWTAWMRPEAQR